MVSTLRVSEPTPDDPKKVHSKNTKQKIEQQMLKSQSVKYNHLTNSDMYA